MSAPAPVLAAVLVDELIRCGVRDVVLSPGSRSAPLAYAIHAADLAGRVRLHVRADERVAGFVALGLALGTGRVVPVLTTSGTAPANLHPAVLEADASGVPLLVLSADRPPELRGTGANQTADQVKLFGSAVRWWHEVGTPEAGRRLEPQAASWRTVVDRAVAAALGVAAVGGSGRPGPVHLNVPLREPLASQSLASQPLAPRHAQGGGRRLVGDDVPAGDIPAGDVPAGDVPADDIPAGRPGGAPWTEVTHHRVVAAQVALGPEPRTLVLLGDLSGACGDRPVGAELTHAYRRLLTWADRAGYPVLAEPFGPREPDQSGALPHGRLLAQAPDLVPDLAPRRIVVAGRLTLSRPMAALLRRDGTEVIAASGDRWADPSHVAHRVVDLAALLAGDPPDPPPDDEWMAAWRRAGEAVHAAVAGRLADGFPNGPAVAATVLGALPTGSRLYVGSSAAPRDLELARRADGADVWASRGLAGIDGCLSTAAGLALAAPGVPTYALLGDLTFLHDANALMIGPDEPAPDLSVVVVNDDGGSIFGTLEYGEPQRLAAPGGAALLRRVFTTPTGADLAARCAAHGVAHVVATTTAGLATEIARPPRGLRVVEVDARGVDRRGYDATLTRLAADALRGIADRGTAHRSAR